MLRLVFLFPYALHGQQGILGTPVSLFANAGLLAPEIAVDGIALRHFVVAETLGEVHASAVGKLPQQAQHLPLDVSGRPFCRVAEEDLVLDLQAPRWRG